MMDEHDILALLLRHDEDGLEAALTQYGSRLRAIAAGIIGVESAEECVNDALLNAWNAIPPEQPTHLRAYLCKLTRNAALNRYALETAKKRGGAAMEASIEELAECLPAAEDPAKAVEEKALSEAISRFLWQQKPRSRGLFLARYFYAMPIRDIALRFSMREGAVKSALRRSREALHTYLTKEGFF